MRALWLGVVGMMLVGCGAEPDAIDDDESLGAEESAASAAASLTDDSYVTTTDPKVARGSHTYVKVGNNSAAVQRAYVKFNVSGVPLGATNLHATLKLYASSTSTDKVEAHVAKSSSWAEETLVASNEPGAQTAVLSKIGGTTKGAWSTFDVSAAVKGNGVVSLALVVPSGSATIQFASKEAGAAVAPVLTVTFTPAPALSTRFGVAMSPHDDARYDALVAQFGGVQVDRSFGKDVNAFLNGFQAQDLARGATSAYSFKYPPKEVVAGLHDAALKSFFQGVADDHPTYWTFWHEPDDELYVDHTFTPSDYRAAWAHIRKIADSVVATRPKLRLYATSIIMEWSMRPEIAPSRPLLGPDGMYPGDDVIDVFGVDVYNASADKGGIGDAATQFGKIIDFAHDHGKAWAVPELGSCPVAGHPELRAQYLKNAISYWKTRGAAPAYAAYFDLVWPSCDYSLDGDTAARAVWHDAVTKGYAAF